MSVNLKQYAPGYYYTESGELSPEFEAILTAEDKIIDSIVMPEATQALNNQFIISADERGIKAYEKTIGIMANPVTEDIEFRRQRLLNRYALRVPFTMPFLRARLDAIIGAGKYDAYVLYDAQTLIIEASATEQQWYEEINITINRIKPANILFINKPRISESIKISETIRAIKLMFNYRVGTSARCSNTIPLGTRQDVGEVKGAEITSIQQILLNLATADTISHIKAVLINGSYITEELRITISDNTAKIEYDVPVDVGITEITNVKFLNSDGEVLTSSPAWVAVTDYVTMIHNFKLKEGA